MPDIINYDIWIITCRLERTDKVSLQYIQSVKPVINSGSFRNGND